MRVWPAIGAAASLDYRRMMGTIEGIGYLTKSDLAYSRLRRAILSGDYAPGSVLNQGLLAETIGISTTPLREALRRLSAEGLVHLGSHRDARVSPLTVEESRDLLELRYALDPLAISLAAERRSQDDIRAARAARQEMERLRSATTSELHHVHREFHAALYRASHNELLASTLDSLWDKAERYRLFGIQAARMTPDEIVAKRKRKFAEHAELLNCVAAGDGLRAAEVMRSHIDNSLEARAVASLSLESGRADTTTDEVVVSD